MRRMARISARSDDMLIVRGVNVFPSQIEELVLRIRHLAPHYQLELTREGHLDQLAVKVECLEGAPAQLRSSLQRELEASIKALVGISTRVHVGDPGSIERSSGKAQRVVDRRERR
jgi:phenylacetate-CoA ligase